MTKLQRSFVHIIAAHASTLPSEECRYISAFYKIENNDLLIKNYFMNPIGLKLLSHSGVLHSKKDDLGLKPLLGLSSETDASTNGGS